jgi:hypothetical protein
MSLEDDLRRIVRDEVRAAVAELREALAAPAVNPTLLSVSDVARSCQVRTKTVIAWISSGALTARKAGRKWVVTPEDLERFLSSKISASDESDDAAVVRILSRRS